MVKSNLNLGLIGNGRIGALINEEAEIVWYCVPRFDGDPTFCSLLKDHERGEGFGYNSVELVDLVAMKQLYEEHSAILITRLYDAHGGAVEVHDFAPRFVQFGRMFTPIMIIRHINRIAGEPRIVVRMRPAYNYGQYPCDTTFGSHHIRYVGDNWTMRVTTNMPITYLIEESPFFLEDSVSLVLGPDETIPENIHMLSRRFHEDTLQYWKEWVRDLAIPFEWQEEVIRAAITLKLNAFEDTGAIVAAMTTSVPEDPNSARNWDYRYCWLRDAYFVVSALNRLSTTETMERYLNFLVNVVADSIDGHLQPVYGISGETRLEEYVVESLPGYRGVGHVRVGNDAYRQVQNDVYGSAILAVAHTFFDCRLVKRGGMTLFRHLEELGKVAFKVYNQPDAGLWERRNILKTHTFSAVMCWAACDRLARIAERLGLPERRSYWQKRALSIHRTICRRAWNEKRQAFVSSFEGDSLDASILLLSELGFLPAKDPRFEQTVAAVEGELLRGNFVYRYVEPDDFGLPENAFIVCTFWYICALLSLGRTEEARDLFGHVISRATPLGLFAEHINPTTGEQWGNFVQTYSMIGLINAAIRLSKRWDEAF
ncbi:MAG TPA: glycoside hydrolase family 15 protein [Syntrophales bacterium]|nr:glycoside hydrolase family 15 protein [Syntrophales bacterium]